MWHATLGILYRIKKANFTCVEVGELGGKDDAPEESGHDAQCGERDVRPERQAETASHVEGGREVRSL